MAYGGTNTRIPVTVSFVTFLDDGLPVTSVAEYKKDPFGQNGGKTPTASPNRRNKEDSAANRTVDNGASSRNTFALTTGSFPQEIILVTRSSYANVKRIEVTLDEAKDIVLERCLFNGDGYGGDYNNDNSTNAAAAMASSSATTTGADPMAAVYDVIGERRLTRGEEDGEVAAAGVLAGKITVNNTAGVKNEDVTPRQRQVEVFELDPTRAGKGIRAIKLRILSGYSDFVGVLGIAVYGEVSEQRIAVMESKAEVNM